jgi:DNA-binding IclR family transcriptional regulator
VLRLFTELEPDAGLSVTEVARQLGVAKSTVSRLMATLASSGLLAVDPHTRRYVVGPTAFRLGNRFAGATIASAVQPLVRDLAQRTGHTAQMGTLRGGLVLYLTVAESAEALRVVASPGDTQFAHASASGRALLAMRTRAQQEEVLRGFLDRSGRVLTPRPGITIDRGELLEELASIRARGYSTSHETTAAGVSALGVPVKGTDDLPLALSLAFPTAKESVIDRAETVAELQRTAERIGERVKGLI